MSINGLNVFGSLTTKSGQKLELSDFDTDGNGQVSAEEWYAGVKKYKLDSLELSTVDTDKDRVISDDEFLLVEQKALMQEALDEIGKNIATDFTGVYSKYQRACMQDLKDYAQNFVANFKEDPAGMADAFKAELPAKYEEIKNNIITNSPEYAKEQAEKAKRQTKSQVVEQIITNLKLEDKSMISAVGRALEKEAETFMKDYKGENLSADLMAHLNNYLNNSEKELMADGINTFNAAIQGLGTYIDSDETETLKKAATELIKSALAKGIEVKLGDTVIKNETGIASAFAKFEDGTELLDAVNKMIESFSDKTFLEKIQEQAKIAAAEKAEKEAKEAAAEAQAEVSKYITDTIKPGNDDVTFFVNDKGEIVFVNYENRGGAFNDTTNFSLQKKFEKLRTQMEKSYEKVIESLNLTDAEKTNLFNIALYLTLSDTSVVSSMYDSQDIAAVMQDVLKNYGKLLEKAAANETTRKYITDYPKGSILAGTTTSEGMNKITDLDYTQSSGITRTLYKYYTNNSTGGGDDWIYIDARKEEGYTYGGGCGNILLLNKTTGTEAIQDSNVVNNSMKAMLKDYIDNYKTAIEPDRIFELFRMAQETAFANMEAVNDPSSAAGTSIYGYGEARTQNVQVITGWNGMKPIWGWQSTGTANGCDASDTMKSDGAGGKLYSAACLLINIAYEMEKLIAREMAGLN